MKKFNIYNFVSDDDFRPALGGVFHDSGYKVACDTIVLVALRSDYPEELEHHVLDKDGKDILTAYPKWRACLPDGVDYKPYSIDPAQFEAFLKERRESWKARVGKGTRWGNWQWNVQIGPAYLRAHKFELFLSAMKEIGATEVYVKDSHRSVYAKTDKGWVLLMPILDYNAESADTCKLA